MDKIKQIKTKIVSEKFEDDFHEYEEGFNNGLDYAVKIIDQLQDEPRQTLCDVDKSWLVDEISGLIISDKRTPSLEFHEVYELKHRIKSIVKELDKPIKERKFWDD